MLTARYVFCSCDLAGFVIRDLEGETNYSNICFTFPEASECIRELAESPNAVHPGDWNYYDQAQAKAFAGAP